MNPVRSLLMVIAGLALTACTPAIPTGDAETAGMLSDGRYTAFTTRILRDFQPDPATRLATAYATAGQAQDACRCVQGSQ